MFHELYSRSVVLVLCIHISMLAYSAWTHSPTIDEPAYLVAGISHWRFGDFEITKVSPPLIRLIAAVPVVLSSPQLDWRNVRSGPGARGEHLVGHDFIVANGHRAFWLFTIARWACIPFSVFGACVCYLWSRMLYGRRSAIAVLMLWCFCPNILAHGALMTPDVGVTALSVAAAFLFWIWFLNPTWIRAGFAGAVLGLAILAKTNAVVLIVGLPLIGFIAAVRQKRVQIDLKRVAFQLTFALTVAIYVLNLGYGFEGSLTRLDQFEFVSRTFRGSNEEGGVGNRFKGHLTGLIPVPFPKAFLEGVDTQRRDFENDSRGEKTYFRGQWYDSGWWWYYFYVVGVKVPLGAWALLFMATTIHFAKEGFGRNILLDIQFVILPGAALFALASSQTGIGHGLRYVLPALPFVFIFASSALRDGVKNRLVIALGSMFVICHVVSSISVYPHSLAYFNLLAGGPANGHAHLLDGNLDWGQNFLYLEQWIKDNPEAKPRHIAHWGFLTLGTPDTDYTEFDFEIDNPSGSDELRSVPPGWYAISVNNLRGDHDFENQKYRSFLARRPFEIIGYTFYVYQISPDDP